MSDLYSIEKKYILELNQGSYRAFDALYALYSKRLYGYALKLTKSHHDAKEIVQDTFVKLWLNREHVQANESFQSYLFTISKNTLLNKVRTVINAPVFLDYLTFINDQGVSENNITDALDLDDFRMKLNIAKKSLTDTQQKVFELCKELGYSNAEVAIRLNLSEQTIKNQLSLALKTLRKKLLEHSTLFFIFFL
jgi:RNA polymerase sigma-70 factor (ECF subfamily)